MFHNSKRCSLLLAMVLGTASHAGFQLGGTVLDQRGQGYPGVNVRLTGSSAMATTDAQGKWNLSGVVSVADRAEHGAVTWRGRSLDLQLAHPRRFQAEVIDLLGKRVGEAIDLRLAAGSQKLPWIENRPWLRTLVRWDGGPRELLGGGKGPSGQMSVGARSLDDVFDTLVYSYHGVTRVVLPWLRGKDTLSLVQFLVRPEAPWDTLVDSRDGNKYRLVTLGGSYGLPIKLQWMSANLRYVPARGRSAPVTVGVAGDGRAYSWATATALPDSCDTSNCFKQVHEPLQGVCPQGWFLTSDKEWEMLWDFVMNQDVMFYFGRGVMESVGAVDPRWDAMKLPYLPASEVRDFFGLSIPPTTLNFWLSTTLAGPISVDGLRQDDRLDSRIGHMQMTIWINTIPKKALLPVRCYRIAP